LSCRAAAERFGASAASAVRWRDRQKKAGDFAPKKRNGRTGSNWFIPTVTKLVEAIRYATSRWEGLTQFIDDGRVEIDSNVVERSIRPIALNRKNALFAGSDGGGENWATIATLVESCKLNAVDPQAYIADTLTKIVNAHPNAKIDDLMP
jgi:transposase